MNHLGLLSKPVNSMLSDGQFLIDININQRVNDVIFIMIPLGCNDCHHHIMNLAWFKLGNHSFTPFLENLRENVMERKSRVKVEGNEK